MADLKYSYHGLAGGFKWPPESITPTTHGSSSSSCVFQGHEPYPDGGWGAPGERMPTMSYPLRWDSSVTDHWMEMR